MCSCVVCHALNWYNPDISTVLLRPMDAAEGPVPTASSPNPFGTISIITNYIQMILHFKARIQ